MNDSDIELEEDVLKSIFHECLMSKIDISEGSVDPNQMNFVEFLVFIARISHEVHKDTDQGGRRLHFKIDSTLVPLLDIANESKLTYLRGEDNSLSKSHYVGPPPQDVRGGTANSNGRPSYRGK